MKMYTLDDKLLTDVPEVRIKDQMYPVDNRAKTVKKLLRELHTMKDGDDGVIDSDEMIIEAAFGKKAKEILDMNLPYKAQAVIAEMAMSAMTGEDYEPEYKEDRFPEEKESN